jgi:hypothetical protein
MQQIRMVAKRNACGIRIFSAAVALAVVFMGSLRLVFGQNAVELLPQNYRLTFENDEFRVVRVLYRPHEHLPLHNHPATPTVYVYLTDSAPVRFSHLEERAFSLIRPAEKAGTFRFSPGRLEKHTVENLGNIESQFLRIELKKLPLGYSANSFRSPKSFDDVHSGLRREFESGRLEIDRIVAASAGAITLPHANADALLIALADTAVEPEDGGNIRQLKAGEVLCPDPQRDYRIRAQDSSAIGHLLRVLIKP